MTRDRKDGGARKGHRARGRRADTTPVGLFEQATFLTIDLDVRSSWSLAPLATVWPWAQQPQRVVGRSIHWLILRPRRIVKTAEAAARLLLAEIETLSPIARRCWDKASKRTFDIGVQAGMGHRPLEEVRLTPETLSRIASIGARLQVTVYPPLPDEAAQRENR